jgi:hypothetical protein
MGEGVEPRAELRPEDCRDSGGGDGGLWIRGAGGEPGEGCELGGVWANQDKGGGGTEDPVLRSGERKEDRDLGSWPEGTEGRRTQLGRGNQAPGIWDRHFGVRPGWKKDPPHSDPCSSPVSRPQGRNGATPARHGLLSCPGPSDPRPESRNAQTDPGRGTSGFLLFYLRLLRLPAPPPAHVTACARRRLSEQSLMGSVVPSGPVRLPTKERGERLQLPEGRLATTAGASVP